MAAQKRQVLFIFLLSTVSFFIFEPIINLDISSIAPYEINRRIRKTLKTHKDILIGENNLSQLWRKVVIDGKIKQEITLQEDTEFGQRGDKIEFGLKIDAQGQIQYYARNLTQGEDIRECVKFSFAQDTITSVLEKGLILFI